jgi:hypothetical protein
MKTATASCAQKLVYEARGHVGDLEADDVVQDVFVAILEGRLRPPRAARGTKGPVAKLAVTGETVKLAALEAAAAKNAAPLVAPSPRPAAAPTACNCAGPHAGSRVRAHGPAHARAHAGSPAGARERSSDRADRACQGVAKALAVAP